QLTPTAQEASGTGRARTTTGVARTARTPDWTVSVGLGQRVGRIHQMKRAVAGDVGEVGSAVVLGWDLRNGQAEQVAFRRAFVLKPRHRNAVWQGCAENGDLSAAIVDKAVCAGAEGDRSRDRRP